jgi:uncharacterized protein (DUF983 family)
MAMLNIPRLDPHSPLRTGVTGRCPRCTQGKLFVGVLKLAKSCDVCGLDFSFADPADGPAFFVMSITSFLSVAIMVILQKLLHLPDWAMIALVSALILGLSLLMLRPIKGWLVNSQFYYKAGEGVLAGPVSSAPCGCEDCERRYAKKIKRAA